MALVRILNPATAAEMARPTAPPDVNAAIASPAKRKPAPILSEAVAPLLPNSIIAIWALANAPSESLSGPSRASKRPCKPSPGPKARPKRSP